MAESKENNEMKDLNKVILMGRLGADPVQTQTKFGYARVRFSLATSRKFRKAEPAAEGAETSATGPEAEITQWHHVVVWGREGEVCAQQLRKGHGVMVEGELRTRKFEGRDGSRTICEVHADKVTFMSRPRTATQGEEGEAPMDLQEAS